MSAGFLNSLTSGNLAAACFYCQAGGGCFEDDSRNLMRSQRTLCAPVHTVVREADEIGTCEEMRRGKFPLLNKPASALDGTQQDFLPSERTNRKRERELAVVQTWRKVRGNGSKSTRR